MPADKKTTITISSLSGDITLDVPPNQPLHAVVERAVAKLNLVGGPWILDQNGTTLDQNQTVGEAGLVDGAILTLSQEEGGGGGPVR